MERLRQEAAAKRMREDMPKIIEAIKAEQAAQKQT